jgi:hypothetical protein
LYDQEECTIGVAAGWATDDGRPLLWKTRDDTETNNEVKYNTSLKYKFISVSNAGSSTYSWMGVNEHGFSIINSRSTDLATDTIGPGNGTLMRDVLGNCKTVAEFQNYLDSTNLSGRSTQANFGVIDSTGAAAIFETGGNIYYKFDADTTANGYIIRTNFSLNGGGSIGKMRYNRSCELIRNFSSGDTLNYKSILRYQMRDFSDDKGAPVPVPYADIWESGIPFGYIKCKNSICHNSSVSSAVIHGVLPNEFPGLTTMWVILGQPASSVSLPYWPVGNTPKEADGDSTAELCDKAKEIGAMLFDYNSSNNYIDSYKLRNSDGKGFWPCIFQWEDHIFSETRHYLDSLRQLTALPVNSMLEKETFNATFALSELEYCRNSLFVFESDCLINVYPNPAVDRIYIHIPERQDFEIRIFNIIGECVLQRELSSGSNTVDISKFKKGIYIIQLFSANRNIQQKLIKM